MRTLAYIKTIALLLFISGCASYKVDLKQKGDAEETIRNAILDFTNTSNLYKKDSVFSVSFQDTVYQMKLNELGDGKSEWVPDDFHEDIVAVGIRANYNRFLLTESATVGSKGKLPSRVIEKGGKLFYWWDDNFTLTEEVLNVFKKYDLLQDDEGALLTLPDFSTDDAQKAAHYYFCKNDLSEYKKVITNKGMGFYEPPSVNCR